MIARLRSRSEREGSAGQGLIEFAIILPVFMLLLIGMLEFGFVFEHNIALTYSTREGARVGAALASGGTSVPCGDVDNYIVAAVQRVITSPGSLIVESRVEEITIFKSDSSGRPTDTNHINSWIYSPGAGPSVDGRNLDFTMASSPWSACSRDNGATPDSLGVGIRYRYQLQTALGAITRFFGGGFAGSLPMSDRTVMALNPTD